jgi:hypothetical protein
MEGVEDPVVDSPVETMDVEVEHQGAIVVEQQDARTKLEKIWLGSAIYSLCYTGVILHK